MALAPLANVSDVRERLGRDLSTDETRRVDALLRDASAVVRGRDVTGQEFTRRTSVVRRRILHGAIVLPQRPVNSVIQVAHPDGQLVTRWRWNGESTVYVFLWNPQTDFEMPWRPGFDVADVTYDHGTDESPDIVVGVVCNIVMRALGVPPDESTVTMERIEGYDYKRVPEAVAGVIGILPDERAALSPYGARSRVGTIRLV